MRILLINDLTEVFGGAEVARRLQQDLLIRRGHQVEYHGSSAQFDILSILKRWFNFYQYFKVRQLIRSFRPDIVHCHNLARMVSPAPVLAAKHLGVPIVMTFHDYYYACPRGWGIKSNGRLCSGPSFQCAMVSCRDRFRGWLYPFNALAVLKGKFHRTVLKSSVNLSICINEFQASLLRIAMDFSEQKLKIVPYFVSIPECPLPWNKNSVQTQLLFIGRLSHEKGIIQLLSALSKLRRSNSDLSLILTVVGEGPLRDEILLAIQELDLEGVVTLTGKLNVNQMQAYLAQSHAVVLPSQWLEVGPIAAQEAMAAGRPVIAPKIGGFTSIVAQGTGWLYEPNDVNELPETLRMALSDMGELKRRGELAFQFASKSFSENRFYEQLSDAYRGVLNNVDDGMVRRSYEQQ